VCTSPNYSTKHAQNTTIKSSGLFSPSLANFAPNQKPYANIAIITDRTIPKMLLGSDRHAGRESGEGPHLGALRDSKVDTKVKAREMSIPTDVVCVFEGEERRRNGLREAWEL
jgi:hypothetical protein